jgi:hypothetical protein
VVHEGEQPYYTARHIGFATDNGSSEITAYGLGKKLLDDTVMRIWLLPDGTICGGDDLDDIGLALAHMKPIVMPPE